MKAAACEGCGSPNLLQLKKIDRSLPVDQEASPRESRISRFGTVCAFLKNGACSKALLNVLDREFDHPLALEERATNPMAGGLMQGYQCGMIWGAALAAGAQAHRVFGPGPRAAAAAIRAAQGLLESFRAQNHEINCLEITDTDPRNKWQVFVNFFVKGGTFSCMRRAADYAPEALRAIQTALAEEPKEAPCDATSCAATLAQRMGASEMQGVMAAGLAGGIGLSGGACGALGAAIWMIGLKGYAAGVSNKVINSRISDTMERFLKSSNYEFECSEIVGRRFTSIDEHRRYLRDGGCSKILDVLSTGSQDLAA